MSIIFLVLLKGIFYMIENRYSINFISVFYGEE